jgi:methylmalonyl-CoA mutase N-terminal domain/subunit
VDPKLERDQAERVRAARARRDQGAAETALAALDAAARGGENRVPRILGAVTAMATVGAIADVMRRVFGEYQPVSTI